MLNNFFYIDNSIGLKKTYQDFIFDVNSVTQLNSFIKSDDYYAFFCQLVAAMISDSDIALINEAYTSQEVDGLVSNIIFSNRKNITINVDFFSLHDLIVESKCKVGIFTSGTTGTPKLVKHSMNSLLRAVKKSTSHENDIWGFAYSPTHFAGLQVFLQALLNYNTIIRLFGLNTSEIHVNIEKCNITHISSTPTLFKMLVGGQETHPKVKRITTGGEKSDITLMPAILKKFPNAKVLNIYASTEAGSLFITNGSAFIVPTKIMSEITIIENELLIHESLLAESDSFILQNGWYHTGDLVEIVKENPLTFTFISRKNEMINVGGYKVNPHEVEKIIATIDGVRDVIVYGKENSVTGNIICCDIVSVNNFILNKKDIKFFLKDKLQNYKIPIIYNFVENISKTKTGKKERLVQ